MRRIVPVSAAVLGCCLMCVALPAGASSERFYAVQVRSRTDIQWLEFFGIPLRGHALDGIVVRIDETLAADLALQHVQLLPLDQDPALPSAAAMRSETYHKNNGVATWLDDLAQAHPAITQRFTLGSSVQGRPIHGIVLGTNLNDPSDAFEVRILGGHHGDEWMGIELPLMLASYLAEGYDTNSRVKTILDSTRVFIVPLVNPDGREISQRENANDVDINRVYGYQYHHGVWSGDTDTMDGAGPYSQPEVRAVADHHFAHRFAASLSFHTSGQDATWFWNYSPFGAPDWNIIVELAQRYAAHTCIDDDCYEASQGSDMYQTYGDTNDFSYGVSGDLDYTIETASQNIAHEWEHNRPAILDFLEQASRGVHGQVTDADTGTPVNAMVRCNDAWPSFTAPGDGRYHRILPAGTWTCSFWAPGYATKTLSNIVVGTGTAVWQDVVLSRLAESLSFGFQAPVVTTNCAYWSNPACEDETHPSAALGPADGKAFSLTSNGLVVIDMLVARQNTQGPDLRVFEGAPYDGEAYEVAVSGDFTGPWTVLGTGRQTSDFYLSPEGNAAVRFVRIRDLRDSMTTNRPGMDLDAVAWLPPCDDCEDEAPDAPQDTATFVDAVTLDVHETQEDSNTDAIDLFETALGEILDAIEESAPDFPEESGPITDLDGLAEMDSLAETDGRTEMDSPGELTPQEDVRTADQEIDKVDTDELNPARHGGYARGGCSSTGTGDAAPTFFLILMGFALAMITRFGFANRHQPW